MTDFDHEAVAAAHAFVTRSVQTVQGEVVENAPVETGDFQESIEPFAATPGYGLEFWTPGDAVGLASRDPAAPRLAKGSSSQAPAGWVPRAIATAAARSRA